MSTTELAPARTATPARAPLGRTARLGAANLVGAALAGVAGLGVTFAVARTLGPAQAGSFFAATSAFVLVGGFARLGTSTGLVYWPTRMRAQRTPELTGAYLRAGLVPVAVLGTLLALAIGFAAPYAVPDYATPLRALAVFIPIAALADALLAASRGMRMMRPTVLLDKLVRPGVQIGLIFGLALLAPDAGLELWALAWSVPYLPVLVIAAFTVWRALPSATPKRRPAPRPTPPPAPVTGVSRAFWRFTAPRAVANAAQTALQRVDVLLVASLAGLGPAAVYAVAGRFVVLGQLANGSISQAVQPRLAEALAVGETGTARVLYRTATSWLILTTWPLHLLVIRYATQYLGLFGTGYRDAAPIVRTLAAAMLLATGCGMVDMVLTMAGRTAWNLTNVLLALAVMVGIDLLLIPRLGALGAAIGLACAIAINNLAPLAQIMVSLKLHPFGRHTTIAAALTVGCFGVLPLLIASPLVAIPLSGAIYTICLYFLRAVLHLPSLISRTHRPV
ncbi:O-antigen/teichoic acid export membrane protein [Allocatelliglobosispora scoriae]|uniref:O-antigen/teichoic acid export membrane protein n=1 Tax=Allocatelliglobosispora scoriae TaxID=643052 RepID=A0A841BXU7_9ACTN|nr:oligosaccharide flippase family protein [Allocatelliglobosispora scoriae]MBB5871602.1 O-antigen/teichoic acid export membrane protein [Allocatelliglobosispora scoriae]